MDFVLGYIAGGIVFYSFYKIQLKFIKKDMEKLKDFDTWKKWK